ncbi:MAG: hypothetical protein HY763_09375 [Planctomycetes bacterium]|nr:hypothetical protein [Planctomycetota bacterium]
MMRIVRVIVTVGLLCACGLAGACNSRAQREFRDAMVGGAAGVIEDRTAAILGMLFPAPQEGD